MKLDQLLCEQKLVSIFTMLQSNTNSIGIFIKYTYSIDDICDKYI